MLTPTGTYRYAAIQPPGQPTGGRFYISHSLDQLSTSIDITHRNNTCGPFGTCDQLLLKAVGPINQKGHFFVRYFPADGGESVQSKVEYGMLTAE